MIFIDLDMIDENMWATEPTTCHSVSPQGKPCNRLHTDYDVLNIHAHFINMGYVTSLWIEDEVSYE